jgi:hypothetical protein
VTNTFDTTVVSRLREYLKTLRIRAITQGYGPGAVDDEAALVTSIIDRIERDLKTGQVEQFSEAEAAALAQRGVNLKGFTGGEKRDVQARLEYAEAFLSVSQTIRTRLRAGNGAA